MPFKFIDESLVQSISIAAQNSSRRRSLYTFHVDNDEKIHRIINVIQPDSYIRPHKHENPDKLEIFIPLKGRLLVIIFAEDGRVSEHVVLEAGKSPWGVEIAPGTLHTTLALDPDTAVYEILEGPWNPTTHKKFPDWAPSEEDREAGQKFLARLRQELMLY